MRTFLIAGILSLMLFACKKDQVVKQGQETLLGWIKLRAGYRWIYQVDSVSYRRDKSQPDTFSFELMEMVDTVFEDNVSEKAARIKIVTRKDSLDFWQFKRMCYAKITDEFYERVEENVRYLRMSFPLVEEAIWNMNSRNNLPPAWLFYQDLYKPYPTDKYGVDSAITIVGKDINNSIEKYRYREVYGKGLGLLFKENVEMLNQGGNWDGYKRTQKLVYAD